MNQHLRRIALCFAVVLSATASIVACSSSEPRERLDEAVDGGGASLPDAGPASDGDVPSFDATDQRPGFDPKDEVVTCTTDPCAVQLVAGNDHFCARMSDGTVRCWGDNRMGSLGVDDAGVSNEPSDAGVLADGGWRVSRVADLSGVIQLGAGGTTTCAVDGDGGLACWGGNDKAQLGLDDAAPAFDGDRHPAPAPVAVPRDVQRVDVGQASACAVLANADVWCWGDNTTKQLARATEGAFDVPAKVDIDGQTIARIAIGTYSGLAVTTAGEVLSWGAVSGPEGSIGARVASVRDDPLPLAIGLGSVTSLAVSSTTIQQQTFPKPPRGVGHACAIVEGDVFCWGDSLTGALGVGVADPVRMPTRAFVTSDIAWAQQVAAAGEITCVRMTDGNVECTGDNTYGALGAAPATLPFSTVFRPAETFTGYAVQVAVTSRSVCALVQGGGVLCWGGNAHGELGQGWTDADAHPAPVAVRF